MLTDVVTEDKPDPAIVAVKRYVPGLSNVAFVFFAELVPLVEKLTEAGPLADQVYVSEFSPPLPE